MMFPSLIDSMTHEDGDEPRTLVVPQSHAIIWAGGEARKKLDQTKSGWQRSADVLTHNQQASPDLCIPGQTTKQQSWALFCVPSFLPYLWLLFNPFCGCPSHPIEANPLRLHWVFPSHTVCSPIPALSAQLSLYQGRHQRSFLCGKFIVGNLIHIQLQHGAHSTTWVVSIPKEQVVIHLFPYFLSLKWVPNLRAAMVIMYTTYCMSISCLLLRLFHMLGDDI